jgi:hypothetical protein
MNVKPGVLPEEKNRLREFQNRGPGRMVDLRDSNSNRRQFLRRELCDLYFSQEVTEVIKGGYGLDI